MSNENGQATAYKPRSGSSAELAIQQLAARGPMLATELADAIDVESKAIHAGLGTAVQYGAIEQWLEDGRTWYGLPGQAPEAAGEPVSIPAAPTDAPALQMVDVAEHARMQEAGDARPHHGREAAQAPIQASRVTEEQRHADERRASAPTGIRIALWSDKRLQIGDTCYSVEETRAIVDYLDSIAREVVQ